MGEPGGRRRLLVNMPMNMDYAHYRGYEGKPIYEKIDGEMKWWDEEKGKFKKVSRKDELMWERFALQNERTASAFYSSNGSLISFYHYDPRAHLDNWRLPFEQNLIQTAHLSSFPLNLPAVGIKMYTALGYQPCDPKLRFPWHDYYSLCESGRIPVICHGSRNGMTTHDMPHYYDRQFPEIRIYNNKVKKIWFENTFISPHAWEPVLQNHPNLYLCLAHFGGDTFWDKRVNLSCDLYWEDLTCNDDPMNWIACLLNLMKKYNNFYVDLSYFLFESSAIEFFKKALAFDPVVKERILFGTDWWMYTIKRPYKKGKGYLKYVKTMCQRILALNDKSLLNSIGVNDSRELLAYFMTINPMRFLQIKQYAEKLEQIYYRHKDVRRNGWRFELSDWINKVPEKIEEFYK